MRRALGVIAVGAAMLAGACGGGSGAGGSGAGGSGAGGSMAGGSGGSGSGGSANSSAPGSIHVSSSAFSAGGTIPRQYTCDGADVSPPLRWSGIPTGAGELSLVMRDPDAPGGNFIHWSVTGIPASTAGLASGERPAGAVEGRNGFGTRGYRGPCPPRGDRPHHYVITVGALSRGSTLASGSLTGTYARR